MKQMLAIVRFEIKRVFQNKKFWLLMFAMPVIFSLIFGGLSGDGAASKIKIALVDEDKSAVTAELAKHLAANELLTLQALSADEASKQLHDKKVAGVITLPHGLQASLEDSSKTDATFQHGPDLAVAGTIANALNDELAQASVQVKAAKTWARGKGEADWRPYYAKLLDASAKTFVTVDSKTVAKNKATVDMKNADQRTIGFSIMFLMMTMVSVTGTILDARRTGVWSRILSTPLSRLQVLGGYMLSFFLTGWIQFGILMGISSLLFGVQWGDIGALVVLVSALMLAVVGLGLFLAGLVKTPEQQSAAGTMVIISTCMLGGVYWPLDIVSPTMQKIADFVPQTWAMRGFTELVARDGSLADILTPVGVLLAFAAVFLVAGISRVRYE